MKTSHSRNVMLVIVLSFFLAFSQLAAADVLTFDDISTGVDPYAVVPNGYGGLDWTNMYYLDSSLPVYAVTGYRNGPVSGTYVAFNAGGEAASVSDGTFDFNGAYLTGAWNDGLNITVTGLLASTPIYSQTVVVDTTGPTWFNFNYVGIDELTFDSFGGTPNPDFSDSGGTQFVMDDFTINVPEPSSTALLSIGVIGLAVALVGEALGDLNDSESVIRP